MSRLLTTLLTALLVGLAGLAGPTAPADASKPRAVARTATLGASTTEVDSGEAVRFAGRVTRTPARAVVRLQRLTGTRWHTVATARTSGRRGTWVRRVVVRGDGRTRFRAVVPGTRRLRTAVSPVRVVDVVPLHEPGTVARVARLVQESDLSGDGRWLAFTTGQSLTPEDANGLPDVYLRDLDSGAVRLVSHGLATSAAAGGTGPSVSHDGRFVVFSTGSVVAPSDTNDVVDVVRWDRDTDTYQLVSVAGTTSSDGTSRHPSISADGRWVAFTSQATSLVDADGDPGGSQVYLRDLNRADAGGLLLISRRPGTGLGYLAEDATDPSVASAGSVVSVVFVSRASVVATVPDSSTSQVWQWRRDGVAVSSLVSATGSDAAGAGSSFSPELSADTTAVAFASLAADLVPGQVDGNGAADVFVRRVGGPPAQRRTHLVSGSRASDLVTAAGTSAEPAISTDGSVVAFTSTAADLFPARTLGNGAAQVVQRRLDGFPRLVSRSRVRGAADAGSGQPAVDGEGFRVVFRSLARDLVTTPPSPEVSPDLDQDAYVWDQPADL